MDFKTLCSLNLILDTRIYTSNPSHTGNGQSCNPTAWNDRSLFLYCIEFPFKAKKSICKVWFAFAPTYKTHTRWLTERLLGLKCAIKVG